VFTDWAAALAALGFVLIVELAALGALAGFLAGLLGVGGGMVMVPFLTWILAGRGIEPDLAVKMGIATAMTTIAFTSLSSVRAHHRKAAVRWDIVLAMAPGAVCGGLLAGGLALSAMHGRCATACRGQGAHCRAPSGSSPRGRASALRPVSSARAALS
jgi:uncharacterized protein